MKFDLPIRVVSEANSHAHWRSRQKRAKEQRAFTRLWVMRCQQSKISLALLPEFPVSVQFTRLAPKTLDTDNLWSAFKHVRDGVADAYGIDDRDPRWKWLEPKQEKSKEYGITIEIQSIAAETTQKTGAEA